MPEFLEGERNLATRGFPVQLAYDGNSSPHYLADETVILKITNSNINNLEAHIKRFPINMRDYHILQACYDDTGWTAQPPPTAVDKTAPLNLNLNRNVQYSMIVVYVADGSTFNRVQGDYAVGPAPLALCGGDQGSRLYLYNPYWVPGAEVPFTIARLIGVGAAWETPYSLGIDGGYIDPKIKNN